MAAVLILAPNDDDQTFVIEMATALGSIVIHVSVPETDESGRALSRDRRKILPDKGTSYDN